MFTLRSLYRSGVILAALAASVSSGLVATKTFEEKLNKSFKDKNYKTMFESVDQKLDYTPLWDSAPTPEDLAALEVFTKKGMEAGDPFICILRLRHLYWAQDMQQHKVEALATWFVLNIVLNGYKLFFEKSKPRFSVEDAVNLLIHHTGYKVTALLGEDDVVRGAYARVKALVETWRPLASLTFPNPYELSRLYEKDGDKWFSRVRRHEGKILAFHSALEGCPLLLLDKDGEDSVFNMVIAAADQYLQALEAEYEELASNVPSNKSYAGAVKGKTTNGNKKNNNNNVSDKSKNTEETTTN